MKSILVYLAVHLLALPCAWCGDDLVLKTTIPMPGVKGRIDHLALDEAGQRLFVAALGNNTVEVIDLANGKVAQSLRGFAEPQGVLFVPETQRLYVANGADGTIRILDTTNGSEIGRVLVGDDADNLRYDSAAKRVYVGYGSGALGVIDPATNQLIATIPLHGHPESFQLQPDGPLIFVNVPGAHQVAVVDRVAQKQIGSWALGFAAANYPLALDGARHRAFVACRMPARILVFNTDSGQEVAKLELHGDCDDVFYDADRKRLYASCGEGYIDVFRQTDADHYAKRDSVKTESKARTCLWAGDRLYLAVPRRDKDAHIMIYAPGAD